MIAASGASHRFKLERAGRCLAGILKKNLQVSGPDAKWVKKRGIPVKEISEIKLSSGGFFEGYGHQVASIKRRGGVLEAVEILSCRIMAPDLDIGEMDARNEQPRWREALIEPLQRTTLSDPARLAEIQDLLEECSGMVSAWKRSYYAFVLDGDQWDYDIGFSDGTEKRLSGSNAYPFGWEHFHRFLQALFPDQGFMRRPWRLNARERRALKRPVRLRLAFKDLKTDQIKLRLEITGDAKGLCCSYLTAEGKEGRKSWSRENAAEAARIREWLKAFQCLRSRARQTVESLEKHRAWEESQEGSDTTGFLERLRHPSTEPQKEGRKGAEASKAPAGRRLGIEFSFSAGERLGYAGEMPSQMSIGDSGWKNVDWLLDLVAWLVPELKIFKLIH